MKCIGSGRLLDRIEAETDWKAVKAKPDYHTRRTGRVPTIDWEAVRANEYRTKRTGRVPRTDYT